MNKNRFIGCFVGLAVGDALGAPIEFCRRGRFKPISDMVEGGKFKLKKGEWTDDTAMALCLAESLIESHGFDPKDQMERYYRWAHSETGYMSSRPKSFGFGQTFISSLLKYRQTGNPYPGMINPKRAGNGCIMRLASIPIFFYPDKEKIIHYSGESAKTTHGMSESIYASRLFGKMLFEALSGKDKEYILFHNEPEAEAPNNIKQIALGAYKDKNEDQIESTFFAGKCLEAALWCFLHTENYKEAVLKAVNLGGDADSTAAVCGQIAGAYYGLKNIPSHWLNVIAKSEMIMNMAERLCESRQGQAQEIAPT